MPQGFKTHTSESNYENTYSGAGVLVLCENKASSTPNAWESIEKFEMSKQDDTGVGPN